MSDRRPVTVSRTDLEGCMRNLFRRFGRDESGATAIEYSMIAALLFAAITAAWPGFYSGFMASWTNVGAVIASAVP